ncbi:MAG: hypothetical protein R6V62_02965, partial [Candidatus Fermentibacteraceae bacterium]
GATGFLRGLWRPLTALLATLAVATVFPIPLKALSETALFLAFWLLLGGRAVLRFPGRLSPENGAKQK